MRIRMNDKTSIRIRILLSYISILYVHCTVYPTNFRISEHLRYSQQYAKMLATKVVGFKEIHDMAIMIS